MHNGGEYPSVDVESSLSQILMEEVPENYSLSSKACQGILRRAVTRQIPLEAILIEALLEQIASSSDQDETTEHYRTLYHMIKTQGYPTTTKQE